MSEPPLRSLFWALFFVAPVSIERKALWSAARMPQYLVGTLEAANQARRQGIGEISVIEFGVGSGKGLLMLEQHAKAVEQGTGVRIRVFGFDTGHGLPEFTGDYRDHPDLWQTGDYPMDASALQQRLGSRTSLVLGNVSETVPRFIEGGAYPPVGFAAVDLDLYSSTVDALRLFSAPNRRMLLHVPLYFDDILGVPYHSFAGERLAISEFNAANKLVKIDVWHGLGLWRPFPEMGWLKQMYIAHDLEAISKYKQPPRAQLI
jgi:hypothetical protein